MLNAVPLSIVTVAVCGDGGAGVLPINATDVPEHHINYKYQSIHTQIIHDTPSKGKTKVPVSVADEGYQDVALYHWTSVLRIHGLEDDALVPEYVNAPELSSIMTDNSVAIVEKKKGEGK